MHVCFAASTQTPAPLRCWVCLGLVASVTHCLFRSHRPRPPRFKARFHIRLVRGVWVWGDWESEHAPSRRQHTRSSSWWVNNAHQPRVLLKSCIYSVGPWAQSRLHRATVSRRVCSSANLQHEQRQESGLEQLSGLDRAVVIPGARGKRRS